MFHLICFICSLLHLTLDIWNFYIYKDLQYWTKWLEDKNLVWNVSNCDCLLLISQWYIGRGCNLHLNIPRKAISGEITQDYFLTSLCRGKLTPNICSKKNVLTRSKKESLSKRPADFLEVKISFIFLYVVRISWTYTKTTIYLIGS